MAIHPLDILRLTHVLTTPTPDDNIDMGGGNSTFGSSGGAPSNVSMNKPSPENSDFQPEHQASDRFTSMLDKYPQENKPGLLRKIFGTAAGTLTGPQAEEQVLHPGRAGQIADWERQIKPLEEAANLERYGNTNMRTLAHDTEANRIKMEHELRLGEQFTQSEATKKELANLKTTHETELTELKAKHAKELADALNKSREGIASGNVTSREKIASEGNTSKEKIASGKNATSLSISSYKGQQISNKPESATNQQQRWLNNAKQLIREQPTGLGKHIKLDPNDPKGFKISDASNGFFGLGAKAGPTKEERDKINEYINNTMPPKSAGSTTIKEVPQLPPGFSITKKGG